MQCTAWMARGLGPQMRFRGWGLGPKMRCRVQGEQDSGFRGSESWATAKVEGCGVLAQDCVSLPLQTPGPGAITEPTSIEDAWPGSACRSVGPLLRFRALFCC